MTPALRVITRASQLLYFRKHLPRWQFLGLAMIVGIEAGSEQAPLETMQRMETRMRTLGKTCAFTYYDGARHGFAVRTHPGFEARAAAQSFDEARRFLDTHLRGAMTHA